MATLLRTRILPVTSAGPHGDALGHPDWQARLSGPSGAVSSAPYGRRSGGRHVPAKSETGLRSPWSAEFQNPKRAFREPWLYLASFIRMTNLNTASLEEIVAAGIDRAAARAMAFWGPFRSWEDLLWISEIDDGVLARLRTVGFEIGGVADQGWPAPKAFRVSSASAVA